MSNTITIEDARAIDLLTIPVPDEGGISVVRGANGSGKSTALEFIQDRLTDRQTAITPRDGQKQARLSWNGEVVMTVGKSSRRKGELDVLTLESRLDLSDLVDPGLKDPDAADARRIKALVSLSGRPADLTAYHELAGGKAAFETLAKPDTLQETDPVVLAAKVKRDFEAAARLQEATEEKQRGAALGFRKSAEGIDLAGESDAMLLQSALEQAIGAESEIKARVKAAVEAGKRAQEAQQTLAEQQAAYTGPNVEQAQELILENQESAGGADERLRTATEEADAKVAAARAALAAAEAERDKTVERLTWEKEKADSSLKAAKTLLEQAQAYAALQQSAKAAIDAAAATQAPTEAEALAAVDAVSRARRALENGAAIRRARQQIEAAEEAEELAREARKRAEQLRDAARGTDDVLSQAVDCPVLRVDKGRLVTTTDRGASEPYAELSEGERWTVGLRIAIDRLDEMEAKGRPVSRIVIVSKQSAWEGIQPKVRDDLDRYARQRKVTLLVAEADDGPLRAEVYGGNGNGKSNGNS